MSRHSKHANDRQFYSYHERKAAGFVKTKAQVLGTECFLPFGFCGLSLKAPKDPVCTPEGYIYDREFILESLLNQKLELQAKRTKFEEQEARTVRKVAGAKAIEDNKEVADFQKGEQAILSNDYSHKRALEKAAVKQEVDEDDPKAKLRKGEMMHINKQEMVAKSFWTAEFTPNAAPAPLKAVDVTTKCPTSGKKLRVKDLIRVKFEVADQKMFEAGGGRGVFCCAVTKHPITHQKAVLLIPSGQVVLDSVLKDCVLKDMKCPITGKALENKDILKLQTGGTGFSAHNKVEAKNSCPQLGRSFAQDNRTAGGHVPISGYTGLR